MKSYLFVYGTLRRPLRHPMLWLLANHAEFVAEGDFQGKMYLVDDYPGAILSNQKADVVRGEVYLLHRPEFVLAELDRYEQCGTGFPEPTEFKRERAPVRLHDGRRLAAWVYLYNRPVGNLQRLSAGDFVSHLDHGARR